MSSIGKHKKRSRRGSRVAESGKQYFFRVSSANADLVSIRKMKREVKEK